MVHGIGLCDEWPMIRYPTDSGQREGHFEENMTITVETYVGKVGGKEGVKLEQQYLVGRNGLELMSFNKSPRDICTISIRSNHISVERYYFTILNYLVATFLHPRICSLP